MSQRKRYVLVGTGERSQMYIDALCKTFVQHAELVALCDLSPTRMAYWNNHVQNELGHAPIAMYPASQFDQMLADKRPDGVIVTSVDSTHHLYIIRALRAGCDVICEKPLAIDRASVEQIVKTVHETGRQVRVTFNLRYTHSALRIREVIARGQIGTPLAADVQWVLDTRHGADYFRRWHREKDKSGGLLVHKATHHFDLVNFWVNSSPKRVFAMGDLKFYGRSNAQDRGEHYDYNRYTNQPAAATDPFALDLNRDAKMRDLYLNAEADSGYIRDRNVFGDDITAEDTMSLLGQYHNGVHLTYSLIAYAPWEGFRACVTGTRGRVELFERHGDAPHLANREGLQPSLQATDDEGTFASAVLYPMFGKPVELPLAKAEGDHGGGDKLILEQLFDPNAPADPYDRMADHLDGARSALLGIAANESIATGLPVDIAPIPTRASRTPVPHPAGAGS